MKRVTVIAAMAVAGVVVGMLTAAACEFSFSYDRIEAPLGTVGEIGVRVAKEHNNCTLPSMDDYQFTWENIQILGETPWEEIGTNLYEKWFQVSLSELGDGYLQISKDCTKEGYEEAVLPITVLAPSDESAWRQAFDGTYPFDDPQIGVIESVFGDGRFEDRTLVVAGFEFDLPDTVILEGDLGTVRVFYVMKSDMEAVTLLVASERQFLRFDYLVVDED
jgi:hypothetical protein